ncbi:hypothetical protein V5F59_14870 [Xanthobacter autotrophicus DSM 431]|uniref:hypothetical protein n=1 Tax=Xanthobacter nonsaccharivorans TaxID=3119912 RepID=UPI00372C1CCB
MWVVVVIVLTSLTNAETDVNRQSTYPTEEACKAAVAKNVPARLDAKHKQAVADGFRRYVCVRAPVAEAPKADAPKADAPKAEQPKAK